MSLRTLVQVIKSPWTYLGILAAVAGLAGGFLYQASQPSDASAVEPTPAAAVEPTPWPDDVPQELPPDFHPSEVRFTLPTDASREAARNCPTGHIGSNAGSDVWHCVDIRGRRLSESEIQALRLEQERDAKLQAAGASDGPVMGELIKLNNGKSLQLPDYVYVGYVIEKHGWLESGGAVSILPERKLVKGDSSVWIDGNGNLRLGLSRSVLVDFPFLREFQDDSHPRKKVKLRGREIKLPDAVYVSLIGSEKNIIGSVPPGIVFPFYELRKGDSSPPVIVVVDAKGKLLPNVPASLLDEFPFLKEFQDE